MISRQHILPASRDVFALKAAEFVESKLAWLYLAYAVPAIVFLSIAMAPFQVADELSHALRADQLGRGKIVSEAKGGMVDGGLVEMGELYRNMWFHADVKQTVEKAGQAGAIVWSPKDQYGFFYNTAQYGPLLYAPQVVGIKLGRITGLTVAQSILLARLLNGLAACLVGFSALSICRRGRALTFATLLLPMTLSQFASVSQDALLIGLSILALAIVSRVLAEARTASIAEFALFAVIVMASAMARPSQVALALLVPALLNWRDGMWARKLAIAVLATVPVVAWLLLLRALEPPLPTGVSVEGQLHFLLGHPLALPVAMAEYAIQNGQWFLQTLVGNLGWTDTPMPGWFYVAAGIALALSLIATGNEGPTAWPAFLAGLTLAGFLVALCGALYLTWSPVGVPMIYGLQGRYLLPVLPLLAWAVPRGGPRFRQLFDLAWWPVLLFPLVSLAVLPDVIMERYYGSWPAMTGSLKALLLG